MVLKLQECLVLVGFRVSYGGKQYLTVPFYCSEGKNLLPLTLSFKNIFIQIALIEERCVFTSVLFLIQEVED